MVTDYTVNPYRYIYDKYTYVHCDIQYKSVFSTLFLSSLNAMYILNVVFSFFSHRTSVDVFIY